MNFSICIYNNLIKKIFIVFSFTASLSGPLLGQFYTEVNSNNYCEVNPNLGSIDLKLLEENFENEWNYPFELYLLNTTTGEEKDVFKIYNTTAI